MGQFEFQVGKSIRLYSLFCQLCFDSLLEDLERLSADHGPAVDQKGGGAAHAQSLRSLGFILDNGSVFARIQALVEGLRV